ncbi:MAG: hypothetical protein OEQ39_05700 [Gammaproteobacteria bacterium]|nr:hypothetical protein [Gammaproteobacteria bacterium]
MADARLYQEAVEVLEDRDVTPQRRLYQEAVEVVEARDVTQQRRLYQIAVEVLEIAEQDINETVTEIFDLTDESLGIVPRDSPARFINISM